MGINLSALSNQTTLTFNTSLLQGNFIKNSQVLGLSLIGDMFSYTIFTIIFLYFLYNFSRKDGYFIYDFVRSLTLSSGITSILSIVLLLINLSGNYRIIVIMNTIFMIGLFATWRIKKQGR